MIQLLHEDDLSQAILLALQPGRRGVFNVVGPGATPLATVLKELGRKPIPVPHVMARALLNRLWRWGIADFPPGELPHLRFQCVVNDTRAREVLGFRPQYSLKETIRSLL